MVLFPTVFIFNTQLNYIMLNTVDFSPHVLFITSAHCTFTNRPAAKTWSTSYRLALPCTFHFVHKHRTVHATAAATTARTTTITTTVIIT